MNKIRRTETDAYSFIKENLKALGWIVKNPSRVIDGQVYTQNECLENDEIRKWLGSERPENIVKVSESFYYLIEAKSNKSKINIAIDEAQENAKKINNSKVYKTNFISE